MGHIIATRMHLSRSQSLILALGLLACFFAIGSFLVKNRSGGSSSVDTALAPETPPSVPARSKIVLQNFQRSETKDGRKVWEIIASRGEFFPEDSLINLKSAHLELYQENGEVVTLKAPKALVTLEANSLTKAIASGGVVITKGEGVTIETKKATYNKREETITSEELVTFRGKGFTVVGEGFEGDVASKIFYLKRNVRSVFLENAGEKDTVRSSKP